MNHPSELKLERHLLDPERSPVKEHVAGCDRCRARVAEMEKQGEDFRRFVYPATLEKVSQPRSIWPLRALWVLAPAAGLATVLLIARTGPTPDYIGEKGAPLTVTVYAALPSGAKALSDGETVPANASLRFRVRSARPCTLSLLSVDAGGQVSKLYAQEMRGDVTLPGGVRLDGKPGPERFFAVCGTAGYEAVEQAARHVGGEIRQKRQLPGVPGAQASLLVEKKP
jgi:hypothetical protein